MRRLRCAGWGQSMVALHSRRGRSQLGGIDKRLYRAGLGAGAYSALYAQRKRSSSGPYKGCRLPRGSHSTFETSVPSHADEGPLEKFEDQLAFPVDVILLLFAFANTGVPFSNTNEVTAMILASLIIGKTVGITLFGMAGRCLGSRFQQAWA